MSTGHFFLHNIITLLVYIIILSGFLRRSWHSLYLMNYNFNVYRNYHSLSATFTMSRGKGEKKIRKGVCLGCYTYCHGKKLWLLLCWVPVGVCLFCLLAHCVAFGLDNSVSGLNLSQLNLSLSQIKICIPHLVTHRNHAVLQDFHVPC